VVRGGEIFTPPLSAGPLPGVTRNTIFKIAADLGMTIHEEQLSRADLYLADEMFLTGTAAEVTPVREIDERVIGEPGPLTKTIQEKYFSIVKGEDEKYFDWLDFVA
jgi:branched-chain amino acid aminotransferase